MASPQILRVVNWITKNRAPEPPGPWTDTSSCLWPVRNQAVQQEVSGRRKGNVPFLPWGCMEKLSFMKPVPGVNEIADRWHRGLKFSYVINGFPNSPLRDISNPSQHSFLPHQELSADFWTCGSLASTSVSALSFQMCCFLLCILACGHWPSSTLCLYPFVWASSTSSRGVCALNQELKETSYIFQLGSVWVNTGFCSICRPGSSHICLVLSYPPIYVGKSQRLEWDFMVLWFFNPDPVLQAFVFFTVTGRRSGTSIHVQILPCRYSVAAQ